VLALFQAKKRANYTRVHHSGNKTSNWVFHLRIPVSLSSTWWNKQPRTGKSNAIQPKTIDEAFVQPQYIERDEKTCSPVVQNRESIKVIPSKVGIRSRRAKDWKKNRQ
jgi:hypothetical protein